MRKREKGGRVERKVRQLSLCENLIIINVVMNV